MAFALFGFGGFALVEGETHLNCCRTSFLESVQEIAAFKHKQRHDLIEKDFASGDYLCSGDLGTLYP